MTTYGVTPTGFVRKTLEIIKAELEADYRSRIGAGVNLQSTSPHGQSVGIHSEREASVWQLAEDCYNARRAQSAAGAAQDSLFALTGAVRRPALRSTTTLTCTGSAGTVIPVGRVVSVAGQSKFQTTAEATIGGGGTITVAAESVDFGPVIALAGTLTTIETAVSGWTSVTNAADAVLGRDRETDSAFRMRREEMLRSSGNAALDAIRTKLLRDVDGVVACSVFENISSVVDVDGRPPKSIEVLVQGGTDTDVATAIFNAKAGGIETYGTDYTYITDATGQQRQVYFSRPTELRSYAHVEVTWALPGQTGYIDGVTLAWPEPAKTAVVEALVAWAAENLPIGKTLYASALVPPTFAVAGAINASIHVGTAPGPSGSAVTADPRTLVTLASGDIVVDWLN